jgi:hypothetical protein
MATDRVFSLTRAGADRVFSFTRLTETVTRLKTGWFNNRGRRNYIVKGRRYFDLTEEELAQVIAQEYATRSEVRDVVNDKPTRKLSRGDFARIVKQAPKPEWDDEEEAAMLLL